MLPVLPVGASADFCAHSLGHRRRGVSELGGGEPAHAVAEGVEVELTVVIVLERLPSAVRSVTVGLDDEPLLGPEEVHGVRADRDVHLRFGQVVAATEAQEGALELGAGAVGRDVAEGEAKELGLADGTALDFGRGDPLEVGERSGRRRHSDAVADGRGVGVQRGGAVQADAGAAADGAADEDVDCTGAGAQQLPQLGS